MWDDVLKNEAKKILNGKRICKFATVFLTTITKNKKFFFQQILMIFAVLPKEIQE